ncbi:hypothetical protein [Nocardioides sp. YIM 152588]|uniref:hypothetical protein n=1 Tax=Nocardioides sp. YIM 152588 TaxID=3158259 RepID=UPI0032E51069
MTTRQVPVPRTLGDEGKRLWRAIARQWASDGLEPDARELRLLEDACHEADVLQHVSAALAEALDEGRMIVKGSTGQPVTNPLIAEARRSRAQIAALLLKLGLDAPDEPAIGPGLTTAEAGRLGGLARRSSGHFD